MTTFFVGQRVRVARFLTPPTEAAQKTLGLEGYVNKLDCMSSMFHGGMIGVTLPISHPQGRNDKWCFYDGELEPVLPDAYKACDDDFKRDLDGLLERQGIAA